MKNIKKSFISFSLILCLISTMVSVHADAPAEFTISTDKDNVEIDEIFNITIWLEGKDHMLDGLIIREISWSPDCLEVVNISVGWWDWLWDQGDNYTSHIETIQAGQKYKTQLKNEACIIKFRATNSGNCIITIDEADVISGGPFVPCILSDITITIAGDNPPEDDEPEIPTNPFIPDEDTEQPSENISETLYKETSDIEDGSFIFDSDDIDESTVEPNQNDDEDEDKKKPVTPLFDIMLFIAIGAVVLIGIVAFVMIKKKKRSAVKPKTYGTWINGEE